MIGKSADSLNPSVYSLENYERRWARWQRGKSRRSRTSRRMKSEFTFTLKLSKH